MAYFEADTYRIPVTKATLANDENAVKAQTLLVAMKKLQEAEEEIKALRQQCIKIKALCEKERDQNELLQQRISQLNSALLEKDNNPSTHILEHHKPKDDQQLLQLQNALSEAQLHNKQLDRVIKFLRERAEESHLEAKQLRTEFQQQQDNLAFLTKKLSEANESNQSLTFNLQAEQKNSKELQNQKNTEIENLNNQIAKLQEETKNIENDLNAFKNSCEDKDTALKIAQQHLAKKMKEAAILSEKNEEQRVTILEFQHNLSEAKSKLSNTQHSLDLQLQHEKHLQEQLQERLHNAETQIKKWEEKYFQMYEKWQEADAVSKSLRNMEEKYNQMQALLGNLGTLLATPHASTPIPQQILKAKEPEIIREIPHKNDDADIFNAEPKTQIESSLFDVPKNNSRFKHSFFD